MKSTAPVHRAALAALLLGFTAAALAADKADSFEPETMESAIDPGANVLVNQASWTGPAVSMCSTRTI